MKRNKKLLVTAVSLALLSGITLTHTFNTHNKQVEKVIGKENIKEKLDTLAVYIKDKDSSDYTQTEGIPAKDSNYKFNSSKSTCTNSVTPVWNDSSWDITLRGITKGGTSCYLYFDEQAGTPASDIIAGGTATDDSMFAGIEGNGVYTWTKGDYSGGIQQIKYFRGNVDNNWVVFGKDGSNYIWWRIIRNNSNGSLRMIYAGTSSSKTSAPATTGEGTQIGKKAFNTSYNNNMYVGFKYTSGEVHGTGTNSTILGEENSTDATTLYGWYNTKLKNNYGSYIDLDAGFCNDRQPSTSNSTLNGSGGTGTTTTYYAASIRLFTNKTPSLLCASHDDIFKTPVGLITADEVSMGGMVEYYSFIENVSSYLYTNSHYWTMSPCSTDSTGYARVIYVDSSGFFTVNRADNTHDVRPVINLKSSTLFETGGNGTSTNPYVVQGT